MGTEKLFSKFLRRDHQCFAQTLDLYELVQALGPALAKDASGCHWFLKFVIIENILREKKIQQYQRVPDCKILIFVS